MTKHNHRNFSLGALRAPIMASICAAFVAGCAESTTPSGVTGATRDASAGGGGDASAGDDGGRKGGPPVWDPAFEGRVYSTKLPILWIDVEGSHFDIPKDTKVRGRVKVIEDHDGTHMGLKNRPVTLESPIGISVRGSSSTGFPQKSYTLEMQKSDGSAAKVPMLDMPAGEDWAIVTCWGDKTCMRNALGLWMGRQFSQWSSRTRFVEVYLNGRYNGISLLTEAIRSERTRINIAKPEATPEDGDVTGGYIFRKEAGGKGSPTTKPPRDWLSTYKPQGISQAIGKAPFPIVYTYHYPRHHSITEPQRTYLHDYMARFEAMMDGPDWQDAKKGYRSWIDVTSWFEYALHGEVTNDVDHYFKSVYWVKAADKDGGKLYQMPAWDFDRVFGNANYREGFKVDNWVHRMNTRFGGECSDFIPTPEGCTACAFDLACVPKPDMRCNPCHEIPYVPFYWDKLWTDPAFTNEMKCRWQALRKTAYSMTNVEERIGRWKKELGDAMTRHYSRWQAVPLGRVVSEQYVSPNGNDIPRFFDDEIQFLIKSVAERIDWLDKNLPGTCAAR